MKRCYKCEELKPINLFHKDCTKKDGFSSKCADCAIAFRKEQAEKYPERNKAISSRYYQSHREDRLAYHRKYNLENKEKISARNRLGYAVRQGHLIKLPCFCGELKTEGHHEDYSKPLDVVWLCRRHHERHHVDIQKKLETMGV